MRGEAQKSPIKFVLFCFNLFTTTTNAKKPLLLITSLSAAAFGYGPKAPHNYHE
jgi:hypothetical protein